jgi:hypothetical protein
LAFPIDTGFATGARYASTRITGHTGAIHTRLIRTAGDISASHEAHTSDTYFQQPAPNPFTDVVSDACTIDTLFAGATGDTHTRISAHASALDAALTSVADHARAGICDTLAIDALFVVVAGHICTRIGNAHAVRTALARGAHHLGADVVLICIGGHRPCATRHREDQTGNDEAIWHVKSS